jgi:hypothetical protein
LELEQENLKVLDGNGLRDLINYFFFITEDLSLQSIKDSSSIAVFLG